MRIIRRVVLWLLVAVVVIAGAAVVVMLSAGGRVITTAVNSFGPQLLGVPVTLKDATFSPLQGRATLSGLHVGNPEGFYTPSLLEADTIAIDVEVLSLFAGTAHIRKIEIKKPRITFERGPDRSNIQALQDKLSGKKPKAAPGTTPAPPPPPGSPAAKKAQKKVIIDELVISDPQLNASLTMLNGHYLIVALGQIDIRDIGKDKGGVTFNDAIRIIVTAITGNIENAVAGLRGTVNDAAKELRKNASPLFDALKDVFGGKKKKKAPAPETAAPPAADTNQPAPPVQPPPKNDAAQ